jgi:hypothetical protein
MAVNLGLLDPEQLLFHSSSSSVILKEAEWTPIPDPLFLRKSGSAVNGTRDLWLCNSNGKYILIILCLLGVILFSL